MQLKKYLKKLTKIDGTIELHDSTDERVLVTITPAMAPNFIMVDIIKKQLISDFGERKISKIQSINADLKIYI